MDMTGDEDGIHKRSHDATAQKEHIIINNSGSAPTSLKTLN